MSKKNNHLVVRTTFIFIVSNLLSYLIVSFCMWDAHWMSLTNIASWQSTSRGFLLYVEFIFLVWSVVMAHTCGEKYVAAQEKG